MPDNRELRKRIRNRRQSARIATSAIKSALSDLSTPERNRLPNMGLKTSRAVTTVGDTEALARATSPAISFTVGKQGKLVTGLRGVRATARHEVGHFTIPGGGEAQHAAMRATSSRGNAPQTGTQLRQARLAGFESSQRRVTRRQKLVVTRRSSASSSVRAKPGTIRAAHQSS
ncbi:hypothetical protein LCGC14_1801250, partial [marine sediment metagenome]